MSISPESRISNIPRIAMAGVALFSLGFKAELKNPIHKVPNPEMTIKADPRLVSYSVMLSNKLVQDYLTAKPEEKTDILTAAPIVAAPTPAEIAAKETTPEEVEEWSKADVCEEQGNWHAFPEGPYFSGGLGISVANWNSHGGRQFAPYGAGATVDEQIVVARRIQINPPDQDGCQKGGW
jgi:hypothetical protein